jgi:hypothetical protein
MSGKLTYHYKGLCADNSDVLRAVGYWGMTRGVRIV